jgi:ADP-ribose diphosphatase
MMSKDKPTILETTVLAKTRVFQIEGVHLRFSNGQERHFERLRGGRGAEAVMIIPVLDRDTILLVKEYGVGLEDYYLGFPKGTVDEEEDVLVAANRELMEETGYGAKKLQILKRMSSAPAYTTKQMKMILATDLYEQRLVGDEPEDIEVVPWKLSQMDQLLMRDDFHEARSIAALYIVRDLIKNNAI